MDEKALSIVKDYITKNEPVVHKTDEHKSPLDVKIIYRNEMQYGDVEYLIESEMDPDLYFDLTYCTYCTGQYPYWDVQIRRYIVVDDYKIFDK